MKLSIKTKLFSSFLFILLLATSLSILVFVLSDQYIRSQQIAILNEKTNSATNSILDYSLTLKQLQQSLANTFEDSAYSIDIFEDKAFQIIQDNPSFDTITLLSPTSRELAVITRQQIAPRDMLGVALPSETFNQALNTDIAFSKVYFPNQQETPAISLYTPILNSAGSVTHIIRGQINLNLLPETLSRLELGEGGIAYILDYEGQIIVHPRKDLVSAKNLLERPVIKVLKDDGYAAIRPQDHYYTNENNTQVIAGSNIIHGLNWILVAEQPTDVVFSQLALTRNLVIGSFIASVALMVLLAIIVSNGLARPIKLLTSSAKRIEKGDLNSRTSINTGDELQDLSLSFNAMAKQLSERQQSLKNSNQALKIERDQQKILLESLTDGVIAIDAHMSIILFNKAAEKITGYKAESLIGRNINAAIQFYRKDSLVPAEQLTNQSARTKQELLESGLAITTDNGVVVLSLIIDPIDLDSSGKNGWIITFTDMTKEKEFEAMKLDFVSMAAHELRTPLTAMRGYLSLLHEEARKKLNKNEQQYLERSFISANQLNALVENLLNLSRVERGALKLNIQPINFEEVIAATIDNLHNLADQKNISITLQTPSKPVIVMADNFRIGEVLTNLIANAINYTAATGKIKITLSVEGQKAQVAINDTGSHRLRQ